MSTSQREELIYLACPYSHEDSKIRQHRFEMVNKVAANLISKGHYVFSPISHGHPIAEAGNLPKDWQFWQGYCRVTLSTCTRMIVLQLEGWEKSTGVQAEIKLAQDWNLPIEYITMEMVIVK